MLLGKIQDHHYRTDARHEKRLSLQLLEQLTKFTDKERYEISFGTLSTTGGNSVQNSENHILNNTWTHCSSGQSKSFREPNFSRLSSRQEVLEHRLCERVLSHRAREVRNSHQRRRPRTSRLRRKQRTTSSLLHACQALNKKRTKSERRTNT